MLPKSTSRRTSQRIKPFNISQPTKKTAQVHLNRISSQFRKKLKHGSTSDLLGSVQSEIGWVGLIILFFCVISVCYIVISIIYSGSDDSPQNLHALHNRAHPDHMSDQHDINAHLSADNAMGHGLNIDPEHWPHHLSSQESQEESQPNINDKDPRMRARNDGKFDIPDPRRDRLDKNRPDFPNPMRDKFDPHKMQEYLEKKSERNRKPRIPGLPDDFDLNNMDEKMRQKIMEQMGLNDKNRPNDFDPRERKRNQRRDRSQERERERKRRRGPPPDIDQENDEYLNEENEKNDINIEDQDLFVEGDDTDIIGDRMTNDNLNKIKERRKRQKKDKRKRAEEDIEPIRRDEGRVDEEEEFEDGDEDNISNWDSIWNTIKTIDMSASDAVLEASDVLEEKAYRIKSAFLHAWHGYAKHAMGHDEIQPVSDLPGDSWGGLGATLIDALDTMMLMGIKDEYKEARIKLQDVHFDIDLQVSFFETTIRHLGGLIGAYEISSILKPSDSFLLQQATSLIDHLLPAFETRLGMPKSMVNLKTKEIKNYGWTKDRSVLSEVGSNQLEFYAMSEHTGNDIYYKKSSNVFNLLNEAQQENIEKGGEIGLFSRLIETDTATFPRNEKVYSLGGMSDSFYEYTLKLWILTGYTDQLAIKMYVESMDAANEKLLRKIYDKKRREEPYYFYGEQWYSKFRGKMEELQCFMPGVLALGSYHALLREKHAERYNVPLTYYEQQLIEKREQHLKLAHVLVESCFALYNEMPTGLAPESIEFNDNEWNPKEMKYQLRPETLESLFILYSLTGKEEYRMWAWSIFESIENHCKTDVAFSGIVDVTELPAKQDNHMQSYVMAETFKYLYLTFDDYAAGLLPLNQFVFNTEAHPIRIFDLAQQDFYVASDK